MFEIVDEVRQSIPAKSEMHQRIPTYSRGCQVWSTSSSNATPRSPESIPALPVGVGEGDLRRAEQTLGLRLPEELRALFRLWHSDPIEGYPIPEPARRDSSSRTVHPRWRVIFATDNGDYYLVVDLDPADHGEAGQVFRYGRRAPGLSWDDEDVQAYGSPIFTYFDVPQAHSEPARVFRRHPNLEQALAAAKHNAGGGVCVDDPGNDAAFLPLIHLADLPHRIPLQQWEINATRIDLGPPAGLSRLCRLDLSGVEVTDLGAVTTLTQLRVLVLCTDQWEQLRESGVQLRNLAIARNIGVRDFADWVNWLAPGTVSTTTVAGTV